MFVPNVGSEVTTETGRATVAYTKLSDTTQMNVYPSDVNGSYWSNWNTYTKRNPYRVFQRQLQIADDYHLGWWKIDVGTRLIPTELFETNQFDSENN